MPDRGRGLCHDGIQMKYIPRYEGVYSITPDGDVTRHFKKHERRVRAWITPNGYMRIKLQGKCFYLHRLVALTYCAPPPDWEPKVVRHMDGDSLNNSAANLKWGSHWENVEDRMHHTKVRAALDIRQRVNIESAFEEGFTAAQVAIEFDCGVELIQEMYDRWDEMEWTF